MRVTTAEFIKNYGSLADKALMEPVTITKNGRDRLVVVSAEEYSRLTRRDRRVIRPEDLTEEQVALIAKAEVPPEYAYLDGVTTRTVRSCTTQQNELALAVRLDRSIGCSCWWPRDSQDGWPILT